VRHLYTQVTKLKLLRMPSCPLLHSADRFIDRARRSHRVDCLDCSCMLSCCPASATRGACYLLCSGLTD